MSKKHTHLLWIVINTCKLIYRYPWLLSVFFILGGINYYYEVSIARPKQSYHGVPQAQQWHNSSAWFRILRNPHFMIGYSDLRGNPLWVSYQIQPVAKNSRSLKRPSSFKSDWRSLHRVKHKDYTGSGYDRGHMAPNYAISRLYGKSAQLDSFFMSNITPQRPKLNRKLWQRLEEVEINYFTKLSDKIWVMTGTIFDDNSAHLKSAAHVKIPTAFYKIYIREDNNETPYALAFIMPQNVKGTEALTQYLSTIDEIEQRTGLDFFSELEDGIEDKLEASILPKSWKLNAVARLKSRY